jgi:hypothetical protein
MSNRNNLGSAIPLVNKDRYFIDPITNCFTWLDNSPDRLAPALWHYGKRMYISRMLWEHHYGSIPPGYYICHKCDNRKCVNVDHFFLGTPKDNVHDAIAKGRQNSRGSSNPSSKLTEEQVNEIRSSTARGIDLAKRYNVSEATISKIKHGRNWKC